MSNQGLLIETMQASHKHTEAVLALMSKACKKMNLTDVAEEFEQQKASLKEIDDKLTKLAALGAQRGVPGTSAGETGPDVTSLARDIDSVRYDLGELKDLLSGAKSDTDHVKRVVMACERDMEDFTAAMDAVNVDLDEMRARVDSTHSIITSRQRVEATVTAEISTMRLDMGDMQEALKAHDAWMEDVSQSLQEAHERCHQLAEDIQELREQTQAKLDAKTDITAWDEMNNDIDASIKTVRDMASALRVSVDSGRRKVDETFVDIRAEIKALDTKVSTGNENLQRYIDEANTATTQILEEKSQQLRQIEAAIQSINTAASEMDRKLTASSASHSTALSTIEEELRKNSEDLFKDVGGRIDGLERHQANIAKETSKRLNALDLRISGLQGASGEAKRDLGKLRGEVNSLTVKSAAHDVDISKNSEDLRKLERNRLEDNQRHKQDMDAVYEELDQKVYEKNFQSLEDNVTKLTRGTVKLCQVVGVFPGARMSDGTEEELDVDVELLNWEDCAQNLTSRVEKTWRHLSSQKFRSILDLVSKKADHSVLRLLQISQQHIESQLDRVRHERELWKEVVDKRAQQPLQLALTLKDPHTGQQIQGPPGMLGALQGQTFPTAPPAGAFAARVLESAGRDPNIPQPPLGPNVAALAQAPEVGAPDQAAAMKASPLAKRIARPLHAGVPAPKP